MKRLILVLVVAVSFGPAALGQQGEEKVGKRHQLCVAQCSVELADCEKGCNRADRDTKRELVCMEGCYAAGFGPCLESCREVVIRGLSEDSK